MTCLSVRPSLRPSHAGIVPSFWQGMIHRKIRKGSPQRNMPNEGGLGFFGDFRPICVISRERCILDTKLLWDDNRKPYASYRMVSLSMTLSDP